MQVRATHRAPLTAALAIARTACAHTRMNRTQIHTLQHSSRTSELPSPTMRHFTTSVQQAFQTLPNLTTHSPQHTPTHGALGSPAMSLPTTHNEPAASSPTRDPTACNPGPLQTPIPTSYSIFTLRNFFSCVQPHQLNEPSPTIPIPMHASNAMRTTKSPAQHEPNYTTPIQHAQHATIVLSTCPTNLLRGSKMRDLLRGSKLRDPAPTKHPRSTATRTRSRTHNSNSDSANTSNTTSTTNSNQIPPTEYTGTILPYTVTEYIKYI